VPKINTIHSSFVYLRSCLFIPESVYLNFNDLSGNVPETICPLRNTKNKDNGGGGLQDLWADCGSWPLTCKCCTVCCDVLSDCEEVTDDNNT